MTWPGWGGDAEASGNNRPLPATTTFGVAGALVADGDPVNRRLLDTERVGQGCVLASPAFARVASPSQVDGQRAPALRFSDPRVMALVGALVITVNAVTGFTNRSLRAQVSAVLGVDYSMAQASYDLRRLRLKGLIVRLPHSNRYV